MIKSKNKGVALIWAIIISSILLIISGTMVSYITKEAQFSFQIGESSRVYSAAKSGVAWAEKYVETDSTRKTIPHGQNLVLDGININVQLRPGSSADCDPDNTGLYDYCITSEASFQNQITRKILVQKRKVVKNTKLNDYDTIGASAPTPQISAGGDGSFSMSFEFWGTPVLGGSDIHFGFRDAAGNNKIYLKFIDDDVSLVAENPTIGLRDETLVDSTQPITPQSYAFVATLSYTRDTVATLRLVALDNLQPEVPCRGEISVDLAGIDMGNLNYIYTNANLVAYSNIPGGDNHVFKHGSNDFYIDGINTIGLGINNPPPPPCQIVSFTSDRTTGSVPLIVNFSGSATGSGMTTNINYGDGSSGIAPGAHTYSTGGIFQATYSCSNAGGTDSRSISIDVNPWLVGPVAGIQVYYMDSVAAQWKTSQTKCNAPQCVITGTQDYLIWSNDHDYSEYPARLTCKLLGGRLPYQSEMSNILANGASYGNNFSSATYWTAIESPYHWTNYQYYAVIQRNPYTNGSNIATPKTSSYPFRCVK